MQLILKIITFKTWKHPETWQSIRNGIPDMQLYFDPVKGDLPPDNIGIIILHFDHLIKFTHIFKKSGGGVRTN